MKKYEPIKYQEDYMGKPGDEVYIAKTGKGRDMTYYLINNFTHDQINMFFDSEKAARDYAKKKRLIIFDK